MEPTSFELTSKQKSLLEALARETGRAIPSLMDEALEGLERHIHPHHTNGERGGGGEPTAAVPSPDVRKPIWEQFADAFRDVPEEELARLPTDLAAQVDHYIYGLPKRPA